MRYQWKREVTSHFPSDSSWVPPVFVELRFYSRIFPKIPDGFLPGNSYRNRAEIASEIPVPPAIPSDSPPGTNLRISASSRRYSVTVSGILPETHLVKDSSRNYSRHFSRTLPRIPYMISLSVFLREFFYRFFYQNTFCWDTSRISYWIFIRNSSRIPQVISLLGLRQKSLRLLTELQGFIWEFCHSF